VSAMCNPLPSRASTILMICSKQSGLTSIMNLSAQKS
jgi:hypothetical protein